MKRKKNLFSAMRRLASIILASGTLMSLLTLTGCGERATIDFMDCIDELSYTGTNGDGKAFLTLDEAKLRYYLKDIDSETTSLLVKNFCANAQFNNGHLSNGDKITFEIGSKYSEYTNGEADKELSKKLTENKIAVKNTTLTYTVSGLPDKIDFDPFEYLVFNVSGISPQCSVNINLDETYINNVYETNYQNRDSNNYPTLNYSDFEIVDYQSGYVYKKGDKVTVKLKDDVVDNLKRYYNLAETSHEYTVNPEKAYLVTDDVLNDENRDAIQKSVDDYANKEINSLRDKTADYSLKMYILDGITRDITGIGMGKLMTTSYAIRSIENVKFNSAYAGIIDDDTGYGIETRKCAYFLYEADVSIALDLKDKPIDDTFHCVLYVKIIDPLVEGDKISCYDCGLRSAPNLQDKIDSLIKAGCVKIL